MIKFFKKIKKVKVKEFGDICLNIYEYLVNLQSKSVTVLYTRKKLSNKDEICQKGSLCRVIVTLFY